MPLNINWKLMVVQILLLFLVIWINSTILEVLFMVYIIWDLLRWAHQNPSPLELRGYLDTKMLEGPAARKRQHIIR